MENLVRPSFQEMHNASNKTLREVFTETHNELVKEGEKWMDTALSYAVVLSLIITVLFAAAFTVPGGNNIEGIPNFLHSIYHIRCACTLLFNHFIANVFRHPHFALLKEDFLVSLINGLLSMFFSIAAMMVAFSATIYIALS